MCQHYLHKADFSLTETLSKQKTFAIRKNKMDLLIRANKHLLPIYIICKKKTYWLAKLRRFTVLRVHEYGRRSNWVRVPYPNIFSSIRDTKDPNYFTAYWHFRYRPFSKFCWAPDLVAKAILSGCKHLWQINEPFVCNKETWEGLVRSKT